MLTTFYYSHFTPDLFIWPKELSGVRERVLNLDWCVGYTDVYLSELIIINISCVHFTSWNLIFFFFFETASHYVAQTGLKFRILLPQPSRCWEHRFVPLHILSWYLILSQFFKDHMASKQQSIFENVTIISCWNLRIFFPGSCSVICFPTNPFHQIETLEYWLYLLTAMLYCCTGIFSPRPSYKCRSLATTYGALESQTALKSRSGSCTSCLQSQANRLLRISVTVLSTIHWATK
jgi:hypothetical protein